MQRSKRIVLRKAEGIGIRQVLRSYISRKLGAFVARTDGHVSLGVTDTTDKMVRECVSEKHVPPGDETIRFLNILTPQKLKLIIETAQEVGATDLVETVKMMLFIDKPKAIAGQSQRALPKDELVDGHTEDVLS